MPGRQSHHPAIGGQYGDPAHAVQPPVPADELGADPLQPVCLHVIMPVRHIAVAALEDLLGIDRTCDRLARIGDPASDRDRGPQHRFARDARPVGALAPDQLALHHRHAQPGRARPVGDVCRSALPRSRSRHRRDPLQVRS
jgi:hypothetical protein